MAQENVAKIKELLKQVKYPGYSRDIVSFGFIKNVAECDGMVKVELSISNIPDQVQLDLTHDIVKTVSALPGIKEVNVKYMEAPKAAAKPRAMGADPWADQKYIPGIKAIVAVASGKGGVGKSTIAVNLACALNQLNYKVGLLDCDIYGPSIPIMMGTKKQPEVVEEDMLLPVLQYGLEVMSIGFLLNDDEPVIWRGPMIQSAIKQFLTGVQWGDLDYLIIDLPPGTGDAQLSLAQAVPITGVVIVSTPQDVALIDAKKGVAMFNKVNVPVVGIVENMSYFICPHCNEKTAIFSSGGAKTEAERLKVPFLGAVPLDTEIRIGGDEGKPIVIANPASPQSKIFMEIARETAAIVANTLAAKDAEATV